MVATKAQNWQGVQAAALPVMGKVAKTNDESIINAVEAHLNQPVRIFATTIPNSRLNFSPSIVLVGDGAGKSLPPINGRLVTSPAGYIDYQDITGTQISGISVLRDGGTYSHPIATVGQHIVGAFMRRDDGVIDVRYSAAVANFAAAQAIDVGTLFDPLNGQAIGFVYLQCTSAAGRWKTSTSVTSIIENSVAGAPTIVRINPGTEGGTSLAVFVVPQITPIVITAAANIYYNHNLEGKPDLVSLRYFNGVEEIGVDNEDAVIGDVTATQVKIDSTGFVFGGGKELRVTAIFFPVDEKRVASSATSFESSWMSSNALTVLAHGLSRDKVRNYEVQEWDVIADNTRNIDRSELVKNFDDTNFNLDWSGLSPTVNLQYRVVAGASVLIGAAPLEFGGYNKFVGRGKGFYVGLQAAMAAAIAGDSFLVARNTSDNVDIVIPDFVRVTWMPGVVSIFTGAAIVDGITLGNESQLRQARLRFDVTANVNSGVRVVGADAVVEGMIEWNSANTLAAAVRINGARTKAEVGVKTSLGTVTAKLVDTDGTGSPDVWPP